jgi:hypothetical protein
MEDVHPAQGAQELAEPFEVAAILDDQVDADARGGVQDARLLVLEGEIRDPLGQGRHEHAGKAVLGRLLLGAQRAEAADGAEDDFAVPGQGLRAVAQQLPGRLQENDLQGLRRDRHHEVHDPWGSQSGLTRPAQPGGPPSSQSYISRPRTERSPWALRRFRTRR